MFKIVKTIKIFNHNDNETDFESQKHLISTLAMMPHFGTALLNLRHENQKGARDIFRAE